MVGPGLTMARSLALLSALLAAAALPAPAGAQGRLNLLPTGEYRCALPGSAAGRAWIDQPERGFTIVRASRYRSADGAGTYLMTGREVRFTGGPMKGTRLLRVSGRMLREIDAEGVPGRLRCLRTGPIPDRD